MWWMEEEGRREMSVVCFVNGRVNGSGGLELRLGNIFVILFIFINWKYYICIYMYVCVWL